MKKVQKKYGEINESLNKELKDVIFLKITDQNLLNDLTLYLSHSNADDQIKTIRKISLISGKSIKKENIEHVSRFFMKQFFYDELRMLFKHFGQFFQEQSKEFKDEILKIYEDEFEIYLSKFKIEKETAEEDLRTFEQIFTHNEFALFLPSSKKKFIHIITILSNYLSNFSFDQDIMNTSVPCIFIMKTIQSIIHKCFDSFKQTVIDPKYETLYSMITDSVVHILEKNFSKDTKKIAGLLFCFLQSHKFDDDLALFYFITFQSTLKDKSSHQDIFKKINLSSDTKEMAKLFNDFDDIGRISIFFGILNLHSVNVYSFLMDGKILLFDVILKDLFSHLTSETEQIQTFFTLQTIYFSLENFIQLLKKDVKFEEPILGYLKQMLQIVWNNWESPIANIFELMKKYFDRIMDIYDILTPKGKEGLQLDELTSQILSSDWNRKGKYPTLLKILPKVGAKIFLEKCPKVFNHLLSVMGNRSLNTQSANLYEELIVFLLKENSDVTKVQDIALKPIIEILISNESEVLKSSIITYIIPKIVKLNDTNFKFILNQIKKGNHPFVIIQILMICKPLDILKNEIEENITILNDSIYDQNENLKLNVFELLTSSTKTTTFPTLTELEMIQKFININLQESSIPFRHNFRPIFQKFLHRIKSCTHKAYKILESSKKRYDNYQEPKEKKKKEKKILEDSFENMSKDTLKLLSKSSIEFLQNLMKMIQNNLYPGCTHEKITFIVMIYHIILEVLNEENNLHLRDNIFWTGVNLFPKEVTKVLLNYLFDRWDKLRLLVYDLLNQFPTPLPGVDEEDFQHLIQNGLKMVSMNRLRESDAGALTLRLIYNRYIVKLCHFIPEICLKNENIPKVSFIKFLVQDIEERITQVEKDIFNITNKSSLTGELLTLKYILLDSNYSEDKEFWKSIIEKILSLLYKIKDIAGKVVSELNFDEDQTESDIMKIDCRGHVYFKEKVDNELLHALIVNCWLAVKESLVIFSTIVQKTNKESILSISQLNEIGNVFINVILSTKHNGIIEKGATAFKDVCKELLQSSNQKMNELPSKWIDVLLDAVKTEEKILRRSAGIPYLIIPILTSERDGLSRPLLTKVMNFLFDLCSNPETSSNKIHALNVLNFIYLESNLGQHILQYIEKGFILSLDGFSSTVWGIRNSSLMCYSSLIKRTIPNVMREQDSIHNILTSGEFFSRNPQLRKYLLEMIEVATKDDIELHPKLYPVLLLLSKLTPSIYDDVNEPHSVALFIPFVIKSTSHKHYMIRSIATRALVSLVSITKSLGFVEKYIEELPNLKKNNEIHGILLLILRFIQHNKFSMNGLLEKILSTKLEESKVPLIKETYYEIIYELLNSKFEEKLLMKLQHISEIINNSLNENHFDISIKSYETKVTKLELKISSIINKDLTFKYIQSFIIKRSQIKIPTLEFLSLNHSLLNPKLKQIILSILFKESEIESQIKLLKSIHEFDIIPIDYQLLWDKLKGFYQNSNIHLQEETIKTMGHLISKILKDKYPKIVSEWIDILHTKYEEELLRNAIFQSVILSKSLDEKEMTDLKLEVLLLSLDYLQDDSDSLRVSITKKLSQFINSNIFLQPTILYERIFEFLHLNYSSHSRYNQFLFSKLSFPMENGNLILPFQNIDYRMFDKDSDNLYKEDLFEIQIVSSYVKRNQNLKNCKQLTTTITEQLEKVIQMILEFDLIWVGGITYHREIFVVIYRLLMGINSFGFYKEDGVKKVVKMLIGMDHTLNHLILGLVETILGDHSKMNLFIGQNLEKLK